MANVNTQRKMGKAGYLFMGLLVVAFSALLIVFAFQTYLLVDTLFPSDNVFMKVVTVFSFDGCCIIYAGLELFYHFKWKHAKELVGIMWGVTFAGSLLCTIAYMNLSSDHLLHQIVNINILIVAYAVVTGIFAGDIVAITFLIKNEYIAYQDWKYGRTPVQPQEIGTHVQEITQDAQEQTFTKAQLLEGLSRAYDEGARANSNGNAKK